MTKTRINNRKQGITETLSVNKEERRERTVTQNEEEGRDDVRRREGCPPLLFFPS